MPMDRTSRSSASFGTTAIAAGTLASIVGVYGFQVVAGRSLGDTGFAPIAVLWTVGFLIATVVMLPVEQYVTRRLVLGGGDASSLRSGVTMLTATFVVTAVLAVTFVVVTRNQFFEGDVRYAIVMLVLTASRTVLALGRGFLAGRRRFRKYGTALAAEAVALLGLGVLAAALDASSIVFAAAMAVSPAAVLAVGPFGSGGERGDVFGEEVTGGAGAFLGYYLVATATSQVILAGGPIVVGLIGGTAAQVSVYFITFTLFRGPITSSYAFLARILPDFTALAATGAGERLRAWSLRIAVGGAVLSVVGFAMAYLLGPEIVTLLYGEEFTPPRFAAGVGGAAVGAGLAALFSGQILVAEGRTRRLAVSWVIATAGAVAAVILTAASDEVTRVAVGMWVGETGALAALTYFAWRWARPESLQDVDRA